MERVLIVPHSPHRIIHSTPPSASMLIKEPHLSEASGLSASEAKQATNVCPLHFPEVARWPLMESDLPWRGSIMSSVMIIT